MADNAFFGIEKENNETIQDRKEHHLYDNGPEENYELQNDIGDSFGMQRLNQVQEFTKIAMPLIKSGASMQSDMKLGWRPQMEVAGAPIPLYYDYEIFSIPINLYTGKEYEPLFLGPRFKHSIALHKAFANSFLPGNRFSYQFKEPSNMALINQIIKQTHKAETPRPYIGMNPQIMDATDLKDLVFDSHFESGNLDMVIKKRDLEYDLYMRVDTNTRGHHQWFHFSVLSNEYFKGKKVKFNIVNFTKGHSLYTQGMRVSISKQSQDYRWYKGGEDIQYRTSNFQKHSNGQAEVNLKQYFMMSFLYEFTESEDKTFFSYSQPYDFSYLIEFLRSQRKFVREINGDYLKESVLCQSLGGVDVPLLTISSRLTSDPEQFQLVKLQEFQDSYS